MEGFQLSLVKYVTMGNKQNLIKNYNYKGIVNVCIIALLCC